MSYKWLNTLRVGRPERVEGTVCRLTGLATGPRNRAAPFCFCSGAYRAYRGNDNNNNGLHNHGVMTILHQAQFSAYGSLKPPLEATRSDML